MTRLYFQTGRLRLRVILVLAAVLVLFGAGNIAAYSAFFNMPARQLQRQGLLFALLLGVLFGVLALYSWIKLRPVADLLDQLRERGVGTAAVEDQAQRAALRFPLGFAANATFVGTAMLGIGLANDVATGMPTDFAVALACATATMMLATCALIYLIYRAMLRPILAHFHHEQVPPGIRIGISSKVTFTIVALGLAVSIPTSLIGSVQLRRLQQREQTAHERYLAQTLARLTGDLPSGALEGTIASIHLEGRGRIRFRATPAPGTARLSAAHGGRILEVNAPPPRPHPHTALVVIVVLLLGLATFVGRQLGSNMSHDVGLVAGRITQLAEALDSSQGQKLRPLVAGVPQYSDLRRLAQTLNELLERIVEISVIHFLAIEKTLEADRVKTQFLANVSHDLRSPLNSVLGFSQLLLREDDSSLDVRQRQDLEIIGRCGNELLYLINQVLDSARIDAGRISLHREDSLPAELLSTALKEAGRRGIPEGIQIDTELQPGMGAVTVDPQRLAQAMTFIINHCVETLRSTTDKQPSAETGEEVDSDRASDQPRRRIVIQLQLKSRSTGDKLLIFRTATTSGGLPEGDLERMFRGFRRRPGRRGLGLELPLARALVELHDGTLEVAGGARAGMMFTASIPLLQTKVLARLRPKRSQS